MSKHWTVRFDSKEGEISLETEWKEAAVRHFNALFAEARPEHSRDAYLVAPNGSVERWFLANPDRQHGLSPNIFISDEFHQPATVAATLEERGKRYGKFEDQAAMSQLLERVMYGAALMDHDGVYVFSSEQRMHFAGKWQDLEPYQKEALKIIVHKISRILNGDANYADSWHDIAGYAQLVENLLNNISL